MPTRRLLSATTATLTALGVLGALAACADSITGPGSASRAAALRLNKTPAAGCNAAPVQTVTVTPVTSASAPLTVQVGQTATFTVCTQYANTFTLSGGDPRVATVTAGTPGRAAEGLPYAQTFTVTAVAPGTVTYTVTDKRGATQTVTVLVPVPQPVITFQPGSPLTLTPSNNYAYITVSEANYTGAFAVTGCTAGTNAQCVAQTPQPGFPSGYVCHNTTGGFTTFVSTSTPQQLYTSYASGADQAFACTFTVSDTFGNQATYTVTSTAAH